MNNNLSKKLFTEQQNSIKKLIKLINENSELPLIFNTYNEDIADDWAYTVREDFDCDVELLYIKDDGSYSDDYAYLVEDYMERYADIIEYKDLSDIEFEKMCKTMVDELEHFKAIVITVN